MRIAPHHWAAPLLATGMACARRVNRVNRAIGATCAAGTACTIVATCVATSTALAGPLADPTRPPASMGSVSAGPALQRYTTASPAANLAAAQAVARAVAAAEPAPPLPLLQSVQVPQRGPAVALLDGRLVKAGDTVDGQVVISIDHQGLVLTGRNGQQRVWLLGGSPKQAPGSIDTNRSASYQPALRTPDTADAANPAQRADRSASNEPQAATTGPLSLAGRTQP